MLYLSDSKLKSESLGIYHAKKLTLFLEISSMPDGPSEIVQPYVTFYIRLHTKQHGLRFDVLSVTVS